MHPIGSLADDVQILRRNVRDLMAALQEAHRVKAESLARAQTAQSGLAERSRLATFTAEISTALIGDASPAERRL